MNPDFASCGFQLSIETVADFPGRMILHCGCNPSSFILLGFWCLWILNALQTNCKHTPFSCFVVRDVLIWAILKEREVPNCKPKLASSHNSFETRQRQNLYSIKPRGLPEGICHVFDSNEHVFGMIHRCACPMSIGRWPNTPQLLPPS